MKKITIMTLALFLCGSVFAITFADHHEGSVNAHKTLTAKVFEMLRNGKYAQAKKFLESIPQCPKGTIKKSQIPAYCTSDKLDYDFTSRRWFCSVVNVESDIESGFVFRDYKLNTVDPNIILHDALRAHYRYLAGNNPDAPGAFDKKKSTQLYNTYKNNAWLEPIVKECVLTVWPTAGEQYTTAESRWGAKLYDRVALAQALNFTINDVLDNYTTFCDSISETEQMLNAVSRRAQEVNDNKPVVAIKRKIFEDILDPEQYKESLNGGGCSSRALAKYMSALGAEQEKQAMHAWKVLAAKPFTHTMKVNAPKLYQFCLANKDGYGEAIDRTDMKEIWCDNFAKNAKKYGLMEPGDIRDMIRETIRSNSNGTWEYPFKFPRE